MSIAEKLTTVAENLPKVYEAGKKSEYDRFWDTLQQNGNLRFYNYLFAYGRYSDEIYNPKYPIILTNAVGVYINCNTINDTKVPINAEGSYLNQTFSGALIKVIRELIVNENTTYNITFANCTELQELNITGIIGKNGFNVQYSAKLSKDSITGIINALSDITTGLAVTLSKTAVNNAFGIDVDDATTWGEGTEYYNLRHSKDNWTISYL